MSGTLGAALAYRPWPPIRSSSPGALEVIIPLATSSDILWKSLTCAVHAPEPVATLALLVKMDKAPGAPESYPRFDKPCRFLLAAAPAPFLPAPKPVSEGVLVTLIEASRLLGNGVFLSSPSFRRRTLRAKWTEVGLSFNPPPLPLSVSSVVAAREGPFALSLVFMVSRV